MLKNVYLTKFSHNWIDDDLSEKLKKLGVKVLAEYNDFDSIHGKDKRKYKIREFWIKG